LHASFLKNYRIKTDETIEEMVDAEMIGDKEYGSMGMNPVNQVKTLFGKLDSVRSSQTRGTEVSRQSELLLSKFTQQVDKIFKNLPKPLEWRTFYLNDLPLLLSTCKEVQDASIQHDVRGRPLVFQFSDL